MLQSLQTIFIHITSVVVPSQLDWPCTSLSLHSNAMTKLIFTVYLLGLTILFFPPVMPPHLPPNVCFSNKTVLLYVMELPF